MITVTETDEFIKRSQKLLKKSEVKELIDFIASNPEAGDIIAKTGGVRKLRYARAGQGKSGSYRVIYYYYNERNPLFLLSLFGKNEKANLSEAEKVALYKGIQILKKGLKS